MHMLSIPRATLSWLLVLSSSLAACGAQSDRLSLDGDWKFTYTRSASTELPKPPSADAYVTTLQLPGWWDQQLERMRNAPWFAQADFQETQGTVKYLSG